MFFERINIPSKIGPVYVWAASLISILIVAIAASPQNISVLLDDDIPTRSKAHETRNSPNSFQPVFFGAMDQTIKEGSYIVDMGVEPQTAGNALKPYGLVYTLVKVFNVPVLWSIKDAKSKDGIDFSYNGTDYKGGPFIIDAGYRNETIDSVITSWESMGVVGTTTTSDFLAPISTEIDYFMNWTLDLLNGAIAEAYLINAGIPSSGYNSVIPDSLGCCNDIFVMPHADPTWATHKNLLDWSDDFAEGGCRGALWMACHAVSVLENVVNPADSSERLNFTMQDTSLLGGEAAVDYLVHADGSTAPYVYDYHDHPVMQFLGIIDGATKNGSEQIYLPEVDWYDELKLGIIDTGQSDVPTLSPGPAVAMAFGHTFGDTTRGRVMIEAGHDLQGSGTLAEQIAAQRAFLNFSFWAVQEKIGSHDIADFDVNIEGGDTIALTISSSGGVGPYTYEWSSDCAGSFSDFDSSVTSFYSGVVASLDNCPIRVTITNDCDSIIGFKSVLLSVYPPPTPPVATNDSFFVFSTFDDSVDVLLNDIDINDDPLSISLLGMDTTANGIFVDLGNGKVQYKSTTSYVGSDSVQYEVCDTTPTAIGGPFCDSAWILVSVDTLDINDCIYGEAYVAVGNGFGFKSTKTGSVSNEEHGVGIDDNLLATVDAGGGVLRIELSTTVAKGDTIWFEVAAQDANLSDYEVSISNDNISFIDTVTLDVTGTSQQTNFYVVQSEGGADYIQFVKNGNTNNKDLKVDYITYFFKECVFADCDYPTFFTYKNGYGGTIEEKDGVGSAESALGAPDFIGANVDNGGYFVVDLEEHVPQGSYLYLFMAHDGSSSSIDVQTSIDNNTYNNLQNYTPDYAQIYQQYQYEVVQSSGIRYIKFDNTSDRIEVDAVRYVVNYCEDKTPVASPDSTFTLEDFQISYDVLNNDLDLQGDPLTLTIYSGPSNGMASVSDSLITYIPDDDFNGLDTVFYSICDTTPLCDTSFLIIEVVPDGCGPGEQAKVVGTGYGFKRTASGVGGSRDAIGVPDGALATLDEGGATLTLELSTLVHKSDTIFFEVSAQDANLADFEVSISDDDITYRDTILMDVTGTTLVELYYVIDDTSGAQYIRFEKNNNTNNQDINIDYVSYPLRDCDIKECVIPFVSVTKNGFGDSVEDEVGVINPAKVIGSPDQDGAEITSGDYLIVYLPEFIPQGGHIYIYMAHDGNASTIDVQISDDNMSYGDIQTFAPNYDQDYQQFDYVVNQVSGARYVRFDNTSQRIDVDALEYFVNYCEDGTPIALPDSTYAVEDFSVEYDILDNDIDLQGDPVTASIISGPSNGIAVLNDSIISYIPDPDFNGTDTILYVICDTTSLCDTTYFLITVTPDGCGVDETAKIVGTGYGHDKTKSGTVAGDKNVIGYPDGAVATIDNVASYLTVELIAEVLPGDTIWFNVAAQGASLSDYEVSISNNGILFQDTMMMGVAGTTLTEQFYKVDGGSTARFIRFEKNGNTNNQDIKVDNISYHIRDCDETSCTLPFVAINYSGFGTLEASDATDPTFANGLPDAQGVDIALGEYLILDLGRVVPQAAHIYLYMATDGTPSAITVQSAKTLGSFTNLVGYLPTYGDPNYQQYEYPIIQAEGIRYLLFNNATDNFFVDAVEYVANYCEDGTPVAVPDSTYAIEDFSVAYNVMDNDFDVQGDSLTPAIINGPSNGSAILSDSLIIYTPDPDFSGIDTILYSVCDTVPLCDTTYFIIYVTPDTCSTGEKAKIVGTGYGFDKLKIGTVGGDKNVIGYPDGAVSTIDNVNSSLTVALSAPVLPGDTIWFNVSAQGATLADYEVSISNDGATFIDTILLGVTGTTLQEQFYKVDGGSFATFIRFSKNGNTNNQDVKIDNVSYHFRACDDTDCILPLVSVNYSGFSTLEESDATNPTFADSAPNAQGVNIAPGEYLTIDLGQIVPPDAHIYLYIATDGTASTIDVQSSKTNGVFSNLISYTPTYGDPNYQQFEYLISQPEGIRYIRFDNATDNFYVDAVEYVVNYCEDGTPVANPDTIVVTEDVILMVDVTANDFDLQNDPFTGMIIVDPHNGMVSINGSGVITYSPDTNYYGLDSFYYKICDDVTPTLCDTTIVMIAVTPVNDPPDALDDYDTLSINNVIIVDVQLNDIEVEMDTMTTSIWINGQDGMGVVLNGDSILYTPDPDFVGNDSIFYAVCDDQAPSLCDTAVLYIYVAPCNYPIPGPLDSDVCITHSVDVDGDPSGGTGNYISHSWTIITGGTSTGAYLTNPDAQVVTLDADTATVGTVLLEYTVTDDKGCPGIDTTIVTIHPELTLSESHIDVSCNATNDGSIDLTIVYCALPITIDWDYNGTGDSDDPEDPDGLAVGTYNVTVTDGAGGLDSLTVVIREKVFSISETHSDVTCNGASDGTIDITPADGSRPISYSWFKNGSPIIDSTQDIMNLDTGTYKVIAMDSLGCKDSLEVIIIENMLLLSETHQDVTTYNGIDGSIDLTVSFGTSPFAYDWDYDGTGDNDDPEDPESLIAGTYKVTVTDSLGCQDSLVIEILEPSPIDLSATTTYVSCVPGSDGSIDLTAKGTFNNIVNAPRTATFPPGSWIIGMDNVTQAGLTFTSGPPGYPNGNGGNGTAPFNLRVYGLANELLQNEVPLFWAIKSGKGRDGIDVSVDAQRLYPTAQSDTSAYDFISGPLIIHPKDTAAAKPVIEGLLADSVKIYQTTEYKSIEYKHKLTFKPRIIILENGGNVPIHSTILDIAGVGTDYWIDTLARDIALDSASCFTFASEPHWKDGQVTAYGDPNETNRVRDFVNSGANFLAQCAGIEGYENYEFFHTTNGILQSGDPYYSGAQKSENHVEYNFSDTYFQIHDTLDQNPSGTFVGIHVASGSDYRTGLSLNVAKDSTQASVTDYDEVMGGIKQTTDSLFGGYVFYMGGHNWAAKQGNDKPYDIGFVNGLRMYLNAAILTPPGRPLCPDLNFETITGPYSYDWDHLPGTDDPEDVAGLDAGTYTVTVTDADGLTSELAVEVSESPTITLSESHINVSCSGASDGSIDLMVTGGVGPFNYMWSTGGMQEDLVNISEGEYSVVVTDFKGCKDSISVIIGNSSVTNLYLADFENTTGDNNWSLANGAVEGNWEIDVPSPYTVGGYFMELSAIEGSQTLVTDHISGIDVDTGITIATSPIITLPTDYASLSLEFSFYFAHDDQSESQDYFLVELRDSTDDSTLYTILDISGDNSYREADWTFSSNDISSYAGSKVYLYIEAADINDESTVEAALDNIAISGVEASISGTVFLDSNFDGVFDGGEGGIQDVIINVFDGMSLVSSDTTDLNGDYEVTDLLGDIDYRVEFINLPADLEITHGPDSKSDIVFAMGGDCNINLGLGNFDTYCEDDPYIITPCFVDGQDTGVHASEPVLIQLPSSADGHDFSGTSPTMDYQVEKLLSHDEIGAVYGIAWQGKSGTMYTSSFHKRYTGFGPEGADAIYQVDLDGNIRGVIKLDSLEAGTNTTGGDVHDWSTGPNNEVYDIGMSETSFDGVGKRGFGDIEISTDMNTLYAINLWDRKLYALDVSEGIADSVTLINSWATRDELGNGDHRPFGLAWHDDMLWVGSVDEDSLVAYVHSFDPVSPAFSLALTIPLDYSRQAFYGNADNTGAMPAAWNLWESSPYDFTPHVSAGEIGYPQAILSDITFADNGDMIIGFRDRFGDQSGAHKYFDTLEVAYTSSIASGDILKACLISGSFVLETGATGSCSSTAGLANSGPGGVEFYHWDIFEEPGFTWDPNANGGAFHWETTQGGLLQLSGASYVITTASDPYSDFSGGVLKLDNSDGGRYGVGTGSSVYDSLEGGYTIFDLHNYISGLPDTSLYAGKANGLGDLEAACMLPISLGNFVWFDANQNGIQDPGEPPLADVAIELYQDSVLIGRDTTDGDGYYFFGGVNGENVFDTASIRPLTTTEIHIPFISAKTNDGTVTGIVMVTIENAQSDTLDKIDSDAMMADTSSPAIITFETGFLGTSEFSQDFGFMGCPAIMDTIMYVGCEDDGYSVMVGSSTYDEASPMGTDTLINSYGCDSIVYTSLFFYPTYLDSINYVGCEGDGYGTMVGSSTYNESNPTGRDTFMTVNGCDSVIVTNLQFNPMVVVEAGMLPSPACSNSPVQLIDLGASITGGIATGKWTTSGSGTFDNNGDFGGATPATTYTLSAADIDAGMVILTLTSDDPAGPCEPEADPALIIINDIRCSPFPFTGN